jgi:hypothetical protein
MFENKKYYNFVLRVEKACSDTVRLLAFTAYINLDETTSGARQRVCNVYYSKYSEITNVQFFT